MHALIHILEFWFRGYRLKLGMISLPSKVWTLSKHRGTETIVVYIEEMVGAFRSGHFGLHNWLKIGLAYGDILVQMWWARLDQCVTSRVNLLTKQSQPARYELWFTQLLGRENNDDGKLPFTASYSYNVAKKNITWVIVTIYHYQIFYKSAMRISFLP